MSFTLPSVTSATTGRDIGSLQISKAVDGIGNEDFSGEEYQFKVDLLSSKEGTGLNQTFSYKVTSGEEGNDNYKESYGTIKSGGTITIHPDETATINGIPAGTYYRVTESEDSKEGYSTTVNGNEGYIVSGTIETGTTEPANFVNTVHFELPQTGGSGTDE